MSAATSLEVPVPRAVTTTMLFRLVAFACPHCGDEREGVHLAGDDGTAYVECETCCRQLDTSVLTVPTEARLEQWRSEAELHADTALRCADGVHRCSYLAMASCRRLAAAHRVARQVPHLGIQCRCALHPGGRLRWLRRVAGLRSGGRGQGTA